MNASPPQPGDRYRCPRCRQEHVIEQPYADRTTAERTHLYITCASSRYFVGIAPPSDVRSPSSSPTL